MKKETVKSIIKEKGLTQWQIAKKLCVSEWTLCRWLRSEPEGELRERILQAIESLAAETQENTPHHERRE
ncbi:MAG: hypothetical protein IJB88_08410 [Clostridia bacterium]|nr:hypothetical protein [Clostridia bacterium]